MKASEPGNAVKIALALALAAAAAVTATGCGGDDGGMTGDQPCEKASGNICSIAGTGTAGDGPDRMAALKTNLYLPQDVTVAPDGRPFIVDWNNHRIRALETDGTLTIVAGVGELGLMADDPTSNRLNHPTNMVFDDQGRLVIAAWHNSRIKMVDLTTGEITDVCGNGMRSFSGDGGPAMMAALNLPVAVLFDGAGNLIIADQANDRLRRVERGTDVITTIAGAGPCPAGTVAGSAECPLGDESPALAARFSFPEGQAAQPGGRIAMDAAGNIYIADTSAARVRRIDAATQMVTTIAGTGVPGYGGDGGPAAPAQISNVSDVAVGPDGAVYVADTGNSCVRAIATDGTIRAVAGTCGAKGFAGDGGPASAAKLDRPTGLDFDAAGNLYIADTHNQRVRVVYR